MITNVCVLVMMIAMMDRKDLISLIIVFSYVSFISLQLLDFAFYINNEEWFFASTAINLSIISMLIICYDKHRDIITLTYTLLVIGFYVIPDIVQFYGFALDGYVRVTALTCLIEIMIVGRGYVTRSYNHCSRAIKRRLFGITDSGGDL